MYYSVKFNQVLYVKFIELGYSIYLSRGKKIENDSGDNAGVIRS